LGLYATTTSLSTRMIGVTFDSLTTALATEMINDAESEVNKYLSRRYNLSSADFQTTTGIPPLVRTLSTRLAEGYMWKSNSRGGKESLKRGESLERSVLDNLKLIAEYKSDLTLTNGSLVSEAVNSAVRVLSNTEDYSNTFNEDDSLSWQIDDDKLTDIASERD